MPTSNLSLPITTKHPWLPCSWYYRPIGLPICRCLHFADAKRDTHLCPSVESHPDNPRKPLLRIRHVRHCPQPQFLRTPCKAITHRLVPEQVLRLLQRSLFFAPTDRIYRTGPNQSLQKNVYLRESWKIFLIQERKINRKHLKNKQPYDQRRIDAKSHRTFH